MSLRSKKIVVTGGAGFIGSALCKSLFEEYGADVISIDDYSSGSCESHVEGVKYIKANTRSINSLDLGNVDLLYHLGEYSRVENSFENLDKIWESNKNGTYQVLNYCKNNNIKMIYAGSSTKFGDGGLGRDQSPYAWTKASNTELVINFGKWYGLNYAITYFYNAYGPGEIEDGQYATLIGRFKRRMRVGKDLGVVLPGSQRRNFTHISDIVSGLILVGTKGVGDEFGIGSDECFSVSEVAGMFGGTVTYLPQRKGNRMDAEVRSERMRDLGWAPTRSLELYIEELAKNGWVDK